MEATVRKILNEAAAVYRESAGSAAPRLAVAAKRLIAVLEAGGTVFFCGNGGSAADAQHLAAELEGRFARARRALAGLALGTNASTVTAVANDMGFHRLFARELEALAGDGDALVALSTSGDSPNVLAALETARRQGVATIGLTGRTGGAMAPLCDILLQAPSEKTPRIQEVHILWGHTLCALIEDALCG
ncbi:MAG: SIS domain-containing protein [Synergistales bacterium]|nr:SIS domain-containing protein [Synergistales bacterium]